MKKLMMMLGVLLPMPLFAADTPATLETLRDQIATLSTTVTAMKQQLDGLRLGGAVGDIGSLKTIVANQGVQIVMATGGYSFFSQESDPPYLTIWKYTAPTYSDHGGNIPGVVVHASNGVTLPAGSYLFRPTTAYSAELKTLRAGSGVGIGSGDVSVSCRRCWWRWSGEAGHATGRVDGDVVWPMIRPAVFTFASPTTIKTHMPDFEARGPGPCRGDHCRPSTTNPPVGDSYSIRGIIERL